MQHQENELLRMEGKEPLPDDDVNEMFKTTPAPSRYETLLLTKQINDHCQNVCPRKALDKCKALRSIGILGRRITTASRVQELRDSD
jgi:hypothetical protein